MATHFLSLPVFVWHPTSDIASWQTGERQVKQSTASVPSPRWIEWLFDADTDEFIVTSFIVPNNYVGTPVLRIFYKCTTATSGTAAFEVRVQAVSPGDATDVDADAYDTVNTGTDVVPGTVGYLDIVNVTLSNADSMAAGDLVTMGVNRDISADSVAQDIEVVGFAFVYNDA